VFVVFPIGLVLDTKFEQVLAFELPMKTRFGVGIEFKAPPDTI